MPLLALFVYNNLIRKSPLPNFTPKSKFLAGSKRKATLDQLHRFLNAQAAGNGHHKVNVIWHDDEVVDS